MHENETSADDLPIVATASYNASEAIMYKAYEVNKSRGTKTY